MSTAFVYGKVFFSQNQPREEIKGTVQRDLTSQENEVFRIGLNCILVVV
jgi:hypothetical protein